MQKFVFAFLAVVVLLSACGQPAPAPVVDDVTSTPSLTPTSTATLLPSATPTASITPLPTIPTFTPTFDVSTIVTVTPAPKAECPKESPNVLSTDILPRGDEPYDENFFRRIVDFLNGGGLISSLNAELHKPNKRIGTYGYMRLTDITNDKNPELFIKLYQSYFILKCENKQYVMIYGLEHSFIGSQADVMDLNQNSIPEIIISINPCADRFCPELWILEWNGTTMNTLLHITGDVKSISDVNGDGLKEIVAIKYPSFRQFEATNREIKSIYAWNGWEYLRKTYDGQEKYRFQIIQDADIESAQGEYEKALKLYEDAITSDAAQSWSPEIAKFFNSINPLNASQPTPIPDATEYPRLAAYAYYRIMLLHIVQGQELEATASYNTLQQTLSHDPHTHPYVEMATTFWEAYQSTHRVYDGCAAAIQYAVEHPEILIPLGSDYHGAQSHIYVPADVCPFR
ncbi:MAG TPA: hypothetical protein PKE62_02220 [Anaerolineales bacterium]|nr:hypothetical protein [Anaerolineales bacterium]